MYHCWHIMQARSVKLKIKLQKKRNYLKFYSVFYLKKQTRGTIIRCKKTTGYPCSGQWIAGFKSRAISRLIYP